MANDWQELIQRVIDLQDDPEIDTTPGPSLQWYPEKYLGDSKTLLMCLSAQGAHFRLLMFAYKGFDLEDSAIPCSLPDDPEVLFALCQRPDDWKAIWEEVKRAWKAMNGRLWNLGLCKAYLAQMEHRRRRSKSARKAATSRWSKRNSKVAQADVPGDLPVDEEEAQSMRPLSNRSEGSAAADEFVPHPSEPSTSFQSHPSKLAQPCDEQERGEPAKCDSQNGSVPTAGESQDTAMRNAGSSHSSTAEKDANGMSETPPFSVSVSAFVEGEKDEEGGVKGGTHEGASEKAAIPRDVAQLAIPASERQRVALLIEEPSRIDPGGHKAKKLTDQAAVREERMHLLARLAHWTRKAHETRVRAGESEDTALELWNAWRSRRKVKAKAERRPWFSEVQTLRKLLDGNHSPSEVLDALLAAGTAGWQGFEWAWLERNPPARGGERHPSGAAGFLPPEDDGIAV